MNPKKKEAPTRRTYVPAVGTPFSEKDALVIGPALLKIAEANGVDDVRSLDKHLVLAAVKADPHHPLRRFVYRETDEEAAEQRRLEICRVLIKSIRVIFIKVGKRGKPEPMFLHVPEGAHHRSDLSSQRSQVLTRDVLERDPMYVSALSSQIRIIQAAFLRLEHIVTMRGDSPPAVARYVEALREAHDAYAAHLAEGDKAAE